MKKAIVMGASSGIGYQVTRLLLADGWRVGLAARRTEPLLKLQEEYKDSVEVASIDVTADDAVSRLTELVKRTGGMDLYFHASGIGRQNMLLEENIEQQTVMTNNLGFTRLVDEVFRQMAGNGGGQIAAISSIAGTKGLGAAPSYSATKAYQSVYLQALRQLAHLRHLPIDITDIRPGFVDTPLLNDGNGYPMLMSPNKVAKDIVRAIKRKRRIATIDWRYRVLVFFWKMIPDAIWIRLAVKTK